MENTDTFPQIFEQLKQLLVPYQAHLKVTKNGNDRYELIFDKPFSLNGRTYPSLYFASVVIEKSYVTLHFFPIYTHPAHFNHIPAGLRKYQKGKACFNFKKADDELLAQTAEMIKDGFDFYQNANFNAGF